MRVHGSVDMPDVWSGFNATDRQRHWWRNGMGMSALVGVVAAMISTTPEPGTWWGVGGCGVVAVVVFLGYVDVIYGGVLLTATGLEFRTFVSRRVVPWNEVADMERRQRVTRSGVWSDLRVVRVRGRSLGIPGTVTHRMMDAELERKQVAIQECWSRAVGG
ncbi:hypothetical protein GCM10017562_63720 [Streptomyces roseofulvus]|uniref:hypothetical protein n=1 Tax=Streptomyces roseofulvus TaxID=33902 RepID=UPI0031FD09C7